MKIMVITSWSDAGFELYGRRFTETAHEFFHDSMDLTIVTDEDLSQDQGFRDFMARHASRRMDASAPGYDYRQDLLRFAHKIFALKVGLAAANDYDYLVWLDGDIETRKKIDADFLMQICPQDKDGALLSRAGSAPHPECGFMSFNLRRKGGHLLSRYVEFYEKDEVLKLSELHDSHVFMAMIVAHVQAFKSDWHDLCPIGGGPYGLDAFENSVLNDYFVHKKGARKSALTNADILARLLGDKVAKVCKPDAITDDPVIVLDCDMQPVELLREAVKKLAGRTVIYRGWYSSDERGAHVDTTRYGINTVVTDLVAFESIELAAGGGFIHMAVGKDYPIPADLPVFRQRELEVMTKEQAKALTGGAYSTNMLVKTQNCVPNETIQANIQGNLGLIKKWVRALLPHRRRAIIVSAGPSLDLPETMDAIRMELNSGAVLFCVKHSHAKLLAAGIVPFGCVLLDPRPHEGISTHGVPRAELLPKAHPDVTYFVASMVDPSTTKRLLDTGGKVVGWHAAVGANEAEVLPDEHKKMLMGGGSSSAGRAMILAWQFLGFSSIGLYAFDSCHFDEGKLDKNARHQDGTEKYFAMEVGVGDLKKTFWTDRDILCQAQDFTRFLQETPWIPWDAHGPGMVAWVWQSSKGRLPRFEDEFA
jgi:hypothetical protein